MILRCEDCDLEGDKYSSFVDYNEYNDAFYCNDCGELLKCVPEKIKLVIK